MSRFSREYVGSAHNVDFFSRKHAMLSHATTHRHSALLQVEERSRGIIMFASLPSWAHVLRQMVHDFGHPRFAHMYEIIPHDLPCKPYLDIDTELLPSDIPDARTLMQRTQVLVRRVFSEDYGVTDVDAVLPDDAFIWLDSSKPGKVSLHMILHATLPVYPSSSQATALLVYRSNHASDPQGAFHLARRLRELDPHGVGAVIDTAVYTKDRAMRLPGSSKAKSPTVALRPVDRPLDADTFLRAVISDVPTDARRCSFIRVPQDMPAPVTAASSSSSDRSTRMRGVLTYSGLADRVALARATSSTSTATLSRIVELVNLKVANGSARPVVPPAVVDAVDALVTRLLPERCAAEYPSWIVVGWVLRRARMPVDLWLRFSARCPSKYDARSCVDTWLAMDPEQDERSGRALYSLGTLIHWAEVADPDMTADWKRASSAATMRRGKRLHYVAYSGEGSCVFGVDHGPRFPQEFLLACYVDDNDDVYAACALPDCCDSSLAAQVDRRLGHLHARDPAAVAFPQPVYVDIPFLPSSSSVSTSAPSTDEVRARQIVDAWADGAFKTLCVKSPMGTGKSSMLLSLIQERFAGLSVLVVSYRQTLAYEQSNKLRGAGFVSYLDVPAKAPLDDRRKFPRVICQYDSLRRLAPMGLGHIHFDVVILDEVESLLRHTVSPTIKSPGMLHEAFADMLACSSRIICLDAFLGDLTIEFFNGIVKGVGEAQDARDSNNDSTSTGCLINTYRPRIRTFRMTNNEAAWTESIIQDLSSGKRVVVPTMSVEQARRLETRVKERLPELVRTGGLVVHTSMQADRLKRELTNVEALWGAPHVKCVIYTPTIEAGCDFSVRGHFDRMYVYICRMSSLPLGLLQMTGRVRDLGTSVIECLAAPTIRLGSNSRIGGRGRITAEETALWLRWTVDAHLDACERAPEIVSGKVYMLPRVNGYLTCLSHQMADRHNADTCFLAELQDLLEAGGNELVYAPNLLSSEEAYRVSREVATPSQKAEVLCSLYMPEDENVVADARARICNNHECASEEDKWLDFKASYLEAYGIEDADEEFVREHGSDAAGNKATLLLLRLMFPRLPHDSVTREELSATECADELRVLHVRGLLRALGMRHPFDTGDKGDYYADDFRSTRLYRETTIFRDYAQVIPLFREKQSKADEQRAKRQQQGGEGWTRKEVTHVVDAVLDSVGLKIRGTQTRQQENGTRRKLYMYALDEGRVEEMRELVLLKLRRDRAWQAGELLVGGDDRAAGELQEQLEGTEIRKYARLLQRRPPPEETEEQREARERVERVLVESDGEDDAA